MIFKKIKLDNAKKKTKQKKLSKKEIALKKERERQIQLEAQGELKKKSLHAMVAPLLAGQHKKYPNNDFIENSLDVIMNKPYCLTDKWIASLNKWSQDLLVKLALEDPETEIGDKIEVKVIIEKRKENKDWGNWRYTVIDANTGWRYNYGSGINYEIDSYYKIKGTVKKHYEGMTILSRVRGEKLLFANLTISNTGGVND
jgi:hypothetical protein